MSQVLPGVTQVAVVVSLGLALGVGWYLSEIDWWEILNDRFLYGIPWGSVLTVVGVVAFYLFAQSGLEHWDDPVTVAFRNWAYLYPTGMVSSGFAHASPAHLLGNLVGTVLLAPIAEYAWGHYPPSRDGSARSGGFDRLAGASHSDGLLSNPWIRALVIFPAVVVIVSLFTSVYALGWSLGFSGTVFAFLGFVLLVYPMTTVIAMVGLTGLNVLVSALREPVFRATVDPGAPAPPAWAGVNVQAHLLGFLVGILLALALLWYRDEQPDVGRVFLATLLIVLARQLWSLTTSSDDVYYQYRGIGVVFVLLLTIVLTVTVAVDDRPLPDPYPDAVHVLAYTWLGVVALGTIPAVLFLGTDQMTVLSVIAVGTLLVVPPLPIVVPGLTAGSLTTVSRVTPRLLLFVAVVILAVVVALPSAVGNTAEMTDEPVPEGNVTVADYHVSYAEDVEHGRLETNGSGLVVVSEPRYVWTVAVRDSTLAHDGNATVPVGGLGWRETIHADRTGWDVTGNDTVYAVDLETRDEQIRSFTSEPVRAHVRIENRTIHLVPTADAFVIEVAHDGSVNSTPIPEVDDTVSISGLAFVTEKRDDATAVFVEKNGTRSIVAEKETF